MKFTPPDRDKPQDLSLANESETEVPSQEDDEEETDEVKIMPVHEVFKLKVGNIGLEIFSTKHDVTELAGLALQVCQDILNMKSTQAKDLPPGVA